MYGIELDRCNFQDSHVPGIMYHVIGTIGLICALGSLKLPETKDQDLMDKLKSNKIAAAPEQNKVVWVHYLN